MKRGRPVVRGEFRQDILDVLNELSYPLTANTIKRKMDQRRIPPCGWHTVRKYLEELAAERLILRCPLPAQPGCKPLVVYSNRKRINRYQE